MHVRHERAHVLRELATRKNLEFRRRMIGKKLSVVTLMEPRAALSDNYLKVELASYRPSNELIEIEIGGLQDAGLREATPACALTVLSPAAP
jgi:tRNA A37 methylthiotransferase MiaB